MGRDLLRPGGRYNVRRTASDEYTMNLPMPTDEQGMTARACPEPDCTPGYFKIRFGTVSKIPTTTGATAPTVAGMGFRRTS